MYTFQFLYLIISFGAVVIIGALGFRVWSERSATSLPVFAWLMAALTLTSLCYVFMAVMQSPEMVYLWARLRFTGLAVSSILFLLMVLDYIGDHEWLRPSRAGFLLIVPITTQILLWTNETHHLFFQQWSMEQVGILSVERMMPGDAWRLQMLYVYFLFAIGVALLLLRAIRSTGFTRQQAAALLLAAFVGSIANFLHIFGLTPSHSPNLTPIGFALAGVLYTITIYQFRLLDLVPIAFDTVFKNMRDAVFVLNDQMTVVAVNPAAQALLSQDTTNIVGKKASDVFAQIPQLTSRCADFSHQHIEIVADVAGEVRTYDLRQSVIRQQKRIIGRLLVLRDITERKLASRRNFELNMEREKSRMLSSFVQYSSHDLRTPLSKMNIALYLARITEDPKTRKDKLDDIEQEISAMTRIIDELHLLTKLENGVTMDVQPISLTSIVQSMNNDIRALIDEKRLRLTYHLSDDLMVAGDLDLLDRAIFHLLHNAALYTAEGGEIRVSTCRDGQAFGVVEITDTGIGIENDALSTIFEHFYKVNTARTANGSGAGLGLALVKKITEAHRGQISVRSIPGQGSTFRLCLPLMSEVRFGEVTSSEYEV